MVGPEPIFPEKSLEKFSAQNPYAGAIVSFTGKVRLDKHAGESTSALYLEAYEPLTSRNIEEVRQECLRRWDLKDVLVQHRVGKILLGEAIVFVATAAKHRRDAFLAADFLMDYLKTDAFFWKKNIGPTGSHWIEPRAQDYQDANRWTQTQTTET